MAEVTRAHLAIAEANIDSLVAPDGTMSKEWVLLLLAKVAAQGAAEAGKAQAEWLPGNGIAVGLGNGQAAWLRVDTGYGTITQVDRYNAYSNQWELTPSHGIVAYMPIDKPPSPSAPEGA